MVVVAAAVDVVDHVFEDESQVVYRKTPGESIDHADYDGYHKEEVYAASVEPALQTFEHVVAA
jgi:hypothetical protein